jgi:catechol 2,3-dioxygenase-like lactoylglutathione lyase family enzyme
MRKISETIYFTRAFSASVTFYQEVLGFQLVDKQDWGFATFDVDGSGPKIGLMDEALSGDSDESNSDLPSPRLGIQVASLEKEHELLSARGAKCGVILGEKGSTRAMNVSDDEGNQFFLWEDASGFSNS